MLFSLWMWSGRCDYLCSILVNLIYSMEELRESLPEGLPLGMVKEFEESYRSALLVRENFIDLRENFKRAADPSLVVNSKGALFYKQFVCA